MVGGIVGLIFLLFLSLSLVSAQVYAADTKINEILVHPSSGAHEWIELYNPDSIDLSGYFLDDDTDFVNDIGSAKKSLATIQGINTKYPYLDLTSSMFNNDGDSVVLFDQSGNIVDQYTYTKDPGENISIGRNPDGAGEFAKLSAATEGLANASLQPAPTLSPTKIPTPTHTPVPTNTLTPTHTPTPQKIFSPTAARAIISNTPPKTNALSYSATPQISIEYTVPLPSEESTSEAVLNASISAKPTLTKIQKNIAKASNQYNWLPVLFSVLGGGCFIVCGILIYWKMRKRLE